MSKVIDYWKLHDSLNELKYIKLQFRPLTLQIMSAFRHPLLLMVVSLPVALAMPEPPLPPPPPPTYPPFDGPRRFYPAGDNMTGPPDGGMEAFCQMLLQAPVPVPPEQIPWFCLCTQCQSNPGPKGDRGDRGLPGS